MNTIQRLQLSTLGPVLALAALAVVSFLNLRAVHRTQVNRYESHRLANELRQSSDELTRLARTYVVSGDPGYERQFWQVLAVRNGEAARPDGRRIPLRKLMEEQGFTVAEFAKLKEAEDNSNALVSTEKIAMHAVKGLFDDGRGGFTRKGPADPALAQRIMHDAQYHADKQAIMDPIGQFEGMIDGRTEQAAESAWRRGNSIILLGVGLALAAAVVTALSLRRHAAALRLAIGDLSSTSAGVAAGAREVSSASRALADGAVEQVASVEDIAASARDVSGMATENARQTHSASEQVSREQQQFGEATARLAALVGAMEEIDEASGRISRINKVIDEIAFQTNILALNAAVEAARAGEAGAGFVCAIGSLGNLKD